MNKKYLKDFQEGENVITPLLISNAVKGVTTSGAPYMSILFSDKTGTIEGKLWDVKDEQANVVANGKVLLVNCDVIKYKGTLQVKVHSLQDLTADQYDLTDFVVISAIPQAEMRQEMETVIAGIKNPILHELVEAVMKEYDHDFYLYPAASRIHHDFIGGLAEHVIGMLRLGNKICDLYPLLNRDLLISGIIVHDIGKLSELSGTIVTEYTVEGKLLGHISIMQAKLNEIATRLGCAAREETILLRHLILSHHGEYEYGSPVLPLVVEAEILSLIDNIDARMNTLGKALKEVNPGEFTPRLFALENRSFYKPVMK